MPRDRMGCQEVQSISVWQTIHLADRRPVVKFLNASKFDNNRIMRWSLKLQPYRYHVEHIPGKQNVGGDFLSRI